jgi:tRNA1(Val) A37 N6-methylase TrmN6
LEGRCRPGRAVQSPRLSHGGPSAHCELGKQVSIYLSASPMLLLTSSRISSIFLEMRRDILTLPRTADAIAAQVVTTLPSRPRILDLGCGSGVFLRAALLELRRTYPDEFATSSAIRAAVTGIELQPQIASQARRNLSRTFGRPGSPWDIRTGDALEIEDDPSYDLVIGNPPWVRLHHLPAAHRSDYRTTFTVARGTYDLCYLFIEKAVRMLNPSGTLALVVPGGLQHQPAATPLRRFLDEAGQWELQPLPAIGFYPKASIDPALLLLKKRRRSATPIATSARRTLSDLAYVTVGVATGADPVFLVTTDAARASKLEPDYLRPVIRGRDLRSTDDDQISRHFELIWPYRRHEGRWVLDDLADAPRIRSYLRANAAYLRQRPRLRSTIIRNPDHWYRFIDPQPHEAVASTPVVCLPDIFRSPAFSLLHDSRTVVLNTCFQLFPKPGLLQHLLAVLKDDATWRQLLRGSRPLTAGYHRTSVTELRQIALPDRRA